MMARNRRKPEGWRNKRPEDPWRHAQAAKGMKTVYPKGRRPRSLSLPVELFKAGGKGHWIDDSHAGIPVHHVLDLTRGIEVVDEPSPHIGAIKLYGETAKYGLTGSVWQYGKATGFDPTPEEVAEKWGAGVILSERPLGTHVGPNVGYHVHPDYDTPGSPYETEKEARAAADREAAKFLRGRSFEKAVEEDFSRVVQMQEAKWAEQYRQYELQKMIKKLPKVD